MNRYKQISFILLIVLLSLLVAGCQNNPTQNIVTSKNDGTFNAGIIQSATEPTNGHVLPENQTIQYSDIFSSTDGSVSFSLNLEKKFDNQAWPVVEIVPHYLTSADAQRVASVLFGNATFYEKKPDAMSSYSKNEIQECIRRWLPYTNVENLRALLGEDWSQEYAEDMASEIKLGIEAFTEKYESASEENSYEICKWSFQPSCFYSYTKEDITNIDTSQYNDQICATLTKNDIPYEISFSKRDKSDYKLNYITAYPNSEFSPCGIDGAIFRTLLCSTSRPKNEQVDAIAKKAQNMLDEMALGEWTVDNCSVETIQDGEYAQYAIEITAVPVFQNVPAIRRTQLGNLKSKETYASNYYLTDARFRFSANGDLLEFEMYSPIDVKEVLNTNVITLSRDELLELAKKHLMLSDYYEYGLEEDFLRDAEKDSGEAIKCSIDVCQMDEGMLRVKVPNTDESYYYVPGIILSGSIDYLGSKTGNFYASSGDGLYDHRIVPLVAINAIDGSVVALSNE